MKKKVLLTIVLILGIVLFVGLAINNILVLTCTPIVNDPYWNGSYQQIKTIIYNTISFIFYIANIVLYLILIIKTWKINYNVKNNYEQWKIDKEEKRKQKVEQKKKKLEEKLKKLQ